MAAIPTQRFLPCSKAKWAAGGKGTYLCDATRLRAVAPHGTMYNSNKTLPRAELMVEVCTV
jgi:hypothetical protein